MQSHELRDQMGRLKKVPGGVRVTRADGMVEIQDSSGTFLGRSPVDAKTCGFVKDAKPDKELHKVIDRLFVGSQDAAVNEKGLIDNGITHILNVGYGIEYELPGNCRRIKVLSIALLDREDFDADHLRRKIHECAEYIDKTLSNNQQLESNSILVHCNAGVSRAPTVTIGYLILKRQLKFEDALTLLKQARPQTQPNKGFLALIKSL